MKRSLVAAFAVAIVMCGGFARAEDAPKAAAPPAAKKAAATKPKKGAKKSGAATPSKAAKPDASEAAPPSEPGDPGEAPPANASTAPATAAPGAAPVEGKPTTKKPTAQRFPKPEHVRGIYLTAWSAGSEGKMENVAGMMDRTELNAVVIDVMDDGKLFWKTGIKMAEDSGSAPEIAVRHPERLFDRLEKHNIYPIARISCFRNKYVPNKFLDLAIQKLDKKSAWHDRSKHYWIDPYNKKNWEYIAEVVDFAMDAGFAEIQLDYVRFPSEGRRSTMFFPAKEGWKADVTDTQVIREFSDYIRERVKARGLALSADIFGIVSSSTDVDQGIGQELEHFAEPFDLVCPMVYPSHYNKGEYGVKDPNRMPYEIVTKSLRDYVRRVPNTPIRPWLQDFALGGVPYGKREVQLQIKAAKEQGFQEYLLWNARNKYTESAVVDTSGLVAKASGGKVSGEAGN